MLKKSKFALAIAAVAAISTLTGCLGDSNKTSDSFACVRTVYKYNTGEISQNKWVNEILFIIPGGICYGIAGFLDTIIFNSIQFWTGENPLLANTTTFTENGVEYCVAKTDSTLTITNTASGEVVEFALSADGKTLSVAANGATSKVAELVAANRAVVQTADGAQEVAF